MEVAQEYSVLIQADCPEQRAYAWSWEVFAHYAGIGFHYTRTEVATLTDFVPGGKSGPLRYNPVFWKLIRQGELGHTVILDSVDNSVHFENGEADWLMTAFYWINCLFEKASGVKKDELGRMEYANSIWKERSMDVTYPFVNECFEKLAAQLKIIPVKRKTQIWFSHDIDVIYGAWLQDGKWLLKRKKPFTFLKMVWSHFTKGPQWLNLTEIVRIEKRFDVRSAFFLLTETGKIDQRRTNGDYDISGKAVRNELQQLLVNGNEIGIHKALGETTYRTEIAKLDLPVHANRNHYLVINWPQDLFEQAENGIRVDATLGYAGHHGFRNAYSLPFYPYDLATDSVIPVLEVPLNVMDHTFSNYLRQTPEEAALTIKAFIKRNAANAIISVLWHNSFFTDFKYRGFPAVYEELLALTDDPSLEAVSLTALMEHYPLIMHNKKTI